LDLTFTETTLTPRGYQPNLFGLAQKKLEGKLSLCLCADPLDEQDRATFTRTMTEYFLSIFFTPGSNPPHNRPSENCYCISCTTTTLLFVTLPNIHRFKKKFTRTLGNKSSLIWLLRSPPHLIYVATLPCNLSLMVCFADINVSQGSVATYARCGGMFNIHLTANLLRSFPVKKFNKSVKI